jgi:uncharacterized protein YlxW (UPF0749 family)
MLGAAILLGILVSLHWTEGSSRSRAAPDQVSQAISRLEFEQAELKRKVGRLREIVNERQRQTWANTALLDDLSSELIIQNVRAGLVDVRGPGVLVVLDDSLRPVVGDANDFIIHDYDLRDVVNVLWMAGAEAVSVNEERVTQRTSIYCVGSTVMVNDTRLSPPYEIRAIGESLRLQDYLRNPGYLAELKMRSERYGVVFRYSRLDSIIVYAYQGSIMNRYAKPGS